jgi:hypothetical protein
MNLIRSTDSPSVSKILDIHSAERLCDHEQFHFSYQKFLYPQGFSSFAKRPAGNPVYASPLYLFRVPFAFDRFRRHIPFQKKREGDPILLYDHMDHGHLP